MMSRQTGDSSLRRCGLARPMRWALPLALVALSGCMTPQLSAAGGSEDATADVVFQGASDNPGLPEGRFVLENQTSWKQWWVDLHAGLESYNRTPDVDFNSSRVVLASLGPHDAGCWHVGFAGTEQDLAAHIRVVRLTIRQPANDTGCWNAVRTPVVAVVVPRDGFAIAFQES